MPNKVRVKKLYNMYKFLVLTVQPPSRLPLHSFIALNSMGYEIKIVQSPNYKDGSGWR